MVKPMKYMTVKEKIFFYSCSVLAFSLPLYAKFVPVLIGLVTLSSFFVADFRLVKRKIWFYSLIVFYGLVALGYFNSTNLNAARFDLEVKLSFLVLPIGLIPFLKNSFSIKLIAKAFVLGCVLAIGIDLGISLYNFIYEKWLIANNLYNLNYGINFFLSSRFSFFQHPSYFAMYISFAIVLVLFVEEMFSKRIVFLFLAILMVGLILTASKAGIICLFLICVYFTLVTRKYKIAIYSLIGLIAVFLLLMVSAPEFANKFLGMSKAISENVDSSSTESSASRILVWDSAMNLIQQKPLFGFGPGDVNDELFKYYSSHGYTGLVEKKLNAHNQFLQTTLALGLIGLLSLIVTLFFLVQQGVKSKNHLIILLALVLVTNFMFESMLETQAGVIFFAFWVVLLGYMNSAEKINTFTK